MTVANGLLLDRETAASHAIVVRAQSSDGSSSVALFTIAIGDADEYDVTPVADSDAAADTVVENAAVGTLVGITAAAADADSTTNQITYSLDNDAGGRFAIDSLTGVVTVAGAHRLRGHKQPRHHRAGSERGRQRADPAVHHCGVQRERRAGGRDQRCRRHVQPSARGRGRGGPRWASRRGQPTPRPPIRSATRSTTTPAGGLRWIP